MKDLKQILICGFGGQGVILAGTILGYAALKDGKRVSGSNAYGAQARGGSTRSEVVIAKDPIRFPRVIESDILIALSQMAYDKCVKDICQKGALVIYDDLLVRPQDLKDTRQVGVPATNTVIRELDSKQVANIAILGALVAITGVVTKQALITSISEKVVERLRGLNLRAFEVGYQLGENLSKDI